MSGVSIDTNPAPAVSADLQAAYEGGGNFMARLQQLSDAKAAADASLAELKLATTAQAALADAQAKQTEVSTKLADATKALDDARHTAASIVARASNEADAIVTQAQTNANSIAASTLQMRSDADAYVSKSKTEADAAMKNAADAIAAAQARESQAQDVLAAHQVALTEANAARVAADEACVAYEQKLADFQTAIDKARNG